MCDPQQVHDFVAACIHHRNEVVNGPHGDFVVPRSIPVPFFGNLAAYCDSPIKIVTAGINPSNSEFPGNGQHPRFIIPEPLNAENLAISVSAYFAPPAAGRMGGPYKWFKSCFGRILLGLQAGYSEHYSGVPIANTALHLDFCSPLATNPVWRNLPAQVKDALKDPGYELFQSALAALKPHIVIVSQGIQHRNELFGADGWLNIQANGIRNDRPVSFKQNENGPLIVWGIGRVFMRRPFGGLNANEKEVLGQNIAQLNAGA